ncbi:hypothetical protein EGW08_019494 [Elysia chlorotica]|uniref:Anaphase-promoting complex subunit 4-like WD40 domain-containing protein n=1 Tax=Elysia chlorotica TaxID=188477 RepID=A0A433STZ1_ELYCH|nr:hypothetical protein EGW08_019494 [Elysia chlorotica]
MARRVLEAELLANMGIRQEPLLGGKELTVVKEHKMHKSFGGTFSMQFNFDGSLLAVGFGSGGIQLFSGETGEMARELRACRQGGSSIMCLRWHPKEPHLLYAVDTEGHIFVYNTLTGELVTTITEQGNEINTIDFCVDGFNFATGGRDLNIRVYETKSNSLLKTFEGFNEKSIVTNKHNMGNTMRVFCIKFHPNNQFVFISGGWDNHIKIWDIRDNNGIKRNIWGPHVCGDALDMKDHTILSGQWTALHSLQEYDYTSGKVAREIKYPNKDGAFLYAAQYLNPDLVFAGGSGTNKAEIIDIKTSQSVGTYHLPGPVHCVDSANQGRVLAAGGIAPTFAMLSLA